MAKTAKIIQYILSQMKAMSLFMCFPEKNRPGFYFIKVRIFSDFSKLPALLWSKNRAGFFSGKADERS